MFVIGFVFLYEDLDISGLASFDIKAKKIAIFDELKALFHPEDITIEMPALLKIG
jgi:hypothetical protein